MKKEQLPQSNGPSMQELVIFPCEQYRFPSRCHIYISGQLMFKDVFVQLMNDGTLKLYNSYSVTSYIAAPRELVAIVKSKDYFIIARPLQ